MPVPDYKGGSIVNLMASLEIGLGGDPPRYPPCRLLDPVRVAARRQVLLLVIDGLGFNYLLGHAGAACLNRHVAGGLTSVFPSTTTTAVTTFLTGDAPQQHGLTGWHMYFQELGAVMAVLPGRPRFGGCALGEAGIDVAALLRPRPFAARISVPAYTLSPVEIADSDFNRAHLGGATLVPYAGLDDLQRQCTTLLRTPGRRYVYAYWPRLDGLGHRHGIHSPEAVCHLGKIDRAFAQLLEAAAGTDTLVLVTADHGQIDPPATRHVDLGDHPDLGACLSLPLCGEPRVAYCYLRPGRETVFDDYAGRVLGDVASVLRPQTLLDEGWLGEGEPHAGLLRRLGDRVLVMQDDHLLFDRLPFERPHRMVGVHGGLSEDEMRVPLVIAET